MTDHSALIERLEGIATDNRDTLHPITLGAIQEAAAAIRDQQARLKRWEPKPVSIGSVGVSYLVGGNNKPLPSAPNQAKEAGE